ncbi:MAG: hypothetical protein WDO13_04455 [Verrucomicrobiota bacterium]
MTARDVIHEIESLPLDERAKVEEWLRARDEALDLAGLEERKNELTGRELVNRIETLFTPEKAANLARRIEEGLAGQHD